MKTKTSLFILALSAVFFCHGCSNAEPEITETKEKTVISFSWWGDDARNEYTLEAIDQFQALYPDIRVECNYSNWSGYQTRYRLKMISGIEPDVMQINYAWLSEYSPDGTTYYDLNQLSTIVDLTSFSEQSLKYGYQNGILNALPIALNTQTFYYRKDLFDQYQLDLPETWEDLFEAAKKFDKTSYPLAMVAKSVWLASISYIEDQTGKTFLSPENKLQFSAKDLQHMLEFYCRLVNENVMPPVESYDRQLISSDTYSGFMGWISDAPKLISFLDDPDTLAIGDYLTGEGEDFIWYIKPATMYAISSKTNYPKESALLLDFLLNSSQMASLQGLEKGIPLSSAALGYLKEDNLLTGIQYDAFLKMQENMEEMTLLNPCYENQELMDSYIDSCSKVLYQIHTSEEEAEKLYRNFQSILAECCQ